MRGLRASFLAELRDLGVSPLVWLAGGATVLGAWGFGGVTEPKSNGFLVYEHALYMGTLVAAFFLVTIAAVSVSTDRTRGTVRFVLPRPVSRYGVVLGKAGALSLLALVLFALVVLASYLVARPYGFGDIVELLEGFDGFGGVAQVEEDFQGQVMRDRLGTATWLVAPALLMVSGLGLVISCLLRSSAGAVIVALASVPPVYFLKEIFGLSDRAARLIPLRAAHEFLDQLHSFARGLSTGIWPEYGLGPALAAVAFAAGLPLLGAALFSRLDLTE